MAEQDPKMAAQPQQPKRCKCCGKNPDEAFLVEDADLAWRATRAGWKVFFDPRMVCFHTGNSSATGKKLRQYLSFRNRHWMIAKNESSMGKAILFVIALPYELARILYMALFNKYLWTKV